jgi:hypothetical protein
MSTFLDDIIPTESIPAAIDAARSIVIVKDFKIGGSAISSWLSENRSALWLDYEDGSEALPGVKINVIAKAKQMGMKRIDFLLKLWADLAADSQSGTPRFNYLIHDKINQLEDWAELWATAYYKQTIPGKNFKGNSCPRAARGRRLPVPPREVPRPLECRIGRCSPQHLVVFAEAEVYR